MSSTVRPSPRPVVAPPPPLPELEVRLVETEGELRRAQRLRYKVFFEEMGALPAPSARLTRRDADVYDASCRHVIVLDHAARPRPFRSHKPRVVATSRMLSRAAADRLGGFYSAAEFDLAPLLRRHPTMAFMELGRSCVLAAYRGRRTVDLLWQGIWAHCLRENVDAIFGCASLPSADPALGLQLSALATAAPATEAWQVRAHPHLRVPMDAAGRADAVTAAALRSLPPLIKGYLRLGAMVGDGAVVDHAFGTTDVFVVLPVGAIGGRYRARFGPSTIN